MSETRRFPSLSSIFLAVSALLSVASFSHKGWNLICVLALICLPFIAITGMMIPVLILHSVVRIIDRARQGHPRVFQFSLKKLLAAVIVIGLVCSSAGMRLRALAAIAAIGGDWNEDKVFLSGTKVSDSELRHLPWMGRVEVVWLCDANISDEGLQYFEQISELRALFIDNTRITDAGVAKLQALPLRWLSLNGTAVSDASVPNLARLTKLERLEVKGAKLTEAGLSRLTAALPLCQISR